MTVRFVAFLLALGAGLVACAKSDAPSTNATAELNEGVAQPESSRRGTAPSIGIKACDAVDAADWEAVLGVGAEETSLNDQECVGSKPLVGRYHVWIRHGNVEQDMKDNSEHTVINQGDARMVATKGNTFVRINAQAVQTAAPKSAQDGVRFISERISSKL